MVYILFLGNISIINVWDKSYDISNNFSFYSFNCDKELPGSLEAKTLNLSLVYNNI